MRIYNYLEGIKDRVILSLVSKEAEFLGHDGENYSFEVDGYPVEIRKAATQEFYFINIKGLEILEDRTDFLTQLLKEYE